MFSFHRPKVYRSSMGCCICKAKSSSSRFTDSKKYEEDFLECFKLATPRQGEICNACVLLVKRWKKLPAGSDRNWQHVVDARAGPGIKSVMKCKSKHKKRLCRKPEAMKKKHFDREYSPAFSDKSEGNEEMELAEADFFSEGGPSAGSSRTASPGASDCEDGADKGEKDKMSEESGGGQHQISDFVDMHYWKKEALCCGTIFRGLNNEILIDPRFMKPCSVRVARCESESRRKSENQLSDSVASKLYSDNSSDSGYDDSSNQELSSNGPFKKAQVSIGANVGTACVE